LPAKGQPFPVRKTLKILWNGMVNAYDSAFAIILSNIYFVVITFAIFILPVTIFSLVYLILVLPLTITGLFYTNFQIASSESVDWKTFFVGIKRYWWAGIRWTLVNFIVLFSTIFYFQLFVERDELWSSALLGLDLGVMAFWILMMFLTLSDDADPEETGLLIIPAQHNGFPGALAWL
jgi:hypothetical protein